MNDILKEPSNWVLSTFGTIILFFITTLFSISDKTPIDGLFTLGFPLLFFKKGYFPPSEEFLVFALIINIIIIFIISTVTVFSTKFLWSTLHKVKYH